MNMESDSGAQIRDINESVEMLGKDFNFLRSEQEDDSALIAKIDRRIDAVATESQSQLRRLRQDVDSLASEIQRVLRR